MDIQGSGATSVCHRCYRKSDRVMFACKVINKHKIEVEFASLSDQIYSEITVLKMVDHPNIIKLEDVFETIDRIYMVLEIMLGGELFDYIIDRGNLNEVEACTLVRKITSAVAHLHDRNIIHRDLKPENLLLTKYQDGAEIKIVDFGLACINEDGIARSFVGTRYILFTLLVLYILS